MTSFRRVDLSYKRSFTERWGACRGPWSSVPDSSWDREILARHSAGRARIGTRRFRKRTQMTPHLYRSHIKPYKYYRFPI